MAETKPKLPEVSAVEEAPRVVQAALHDPRVPKVYGNHFTIVLGSNDVTVLFGNNGVSSGVVNLTYPLARALAGRLATVVAEYEKDLKTKVLDLETIQEIAESK